ncbi:MAG: SDR family NAD(P)-dependent oxidoreductase [Bacilli bacterium]|nr:SDR family NAD(P)-dependent oxidoreductase [Bacilli bacterium]
MKEKEDSKKKSAIVIGGSSGIGDSIVELLLNKNYKVHQISRHESLNPRVKNHVCDVINEDNLKKTISEIGKTEQGIDVLVYSAGCSMAIPLEYTKRSEYRYLFDVNFFGIMESIKSVIPFMKNKKGGRIILISSLGSNIPIAYDTFYSASKAAIDSLAFTSNIELNDFNIYVTSVLPGGTKTSFTYKRKINNHHAGEYRSLAYAVKRLEHMEQVGMRPEKVAKVVYRQIKKERPKIIVVVGLKNKIFYWISKLMPKKWLFKIVKRAFTSE